MTLCSTWNISPGGHVEHSGATHIVWQSSCGSPGLAVRLAVWLTLVAPKG